MTDAELVDAVTKRNGEIKNPPVIRGLIAKFAGPAPAQARDVPQDKRLQFLDELKTLKA